MRAQAFIRTISFLCISFSAMLLPPLLVSLWRQDGQAGHFALIAAVVLAVGSLLWWPFRRHPLQLHNRDGYLIVATFWLLLGALGAIPFLWTLHLSFGAALFESVSGLTTTGATVLTGLDRLPPSLLFYRQEIQWFGGMGLVVLAVAILPLLGTGGMSVYRAEAPGPMKEEKLTPRLGSTARVLWIVYVGFTVACALAYWWAGMTPFDAISHSLSTLSTGGFSTHDASLGYYHSIRVELVAIVFMLVGGVNFSIHYLALHQRDPLVYLRDVEVRTFLLFVAGVILFIAGNLWLLHTYSHWTRALRNSAFEVVSIITSTGFGTADFSTWPLFLPVLLIFISFIGGCGGSTAGGIKVMRMLALAKMGRRELRRLYHPRASFPIKIGGRAVPEKTLQAIWGFFSVYIGAFVLLMLAMMWAGLDQVSAFSAIATCMNNLGPGLGRVTANFAGVSDSAKLIGVLAMLAGRLEVFTVMVLLHPAYWRD